ncbi:TetR/AcrR family transcriptional regulator [Streptomyces sp. NPDC001508]|uniref:TetR/AcrR family transcriptional regulator n=1 Tax=Streptomyces sp. NPDC001508 TaxID=3154656 RepID=UPI00333452A5
MRLCTSVGGGSGCGLSAAYAGAVTPRAGQETEQRADAVRNRARILRIAREQLAAGDRSLQLNAIARLAGVGVGTVYRHFPNRHALVEALSEERFRELIAEAQAAVAAEDPLAGLRRLLRFALDRMLDDPDFAAVLESAGDVRSQASGMGAELDQAVTGLLDRARLTGAIRNDVDAEDVRRLLCGVQHAVRSGGGAHRDLYLGVPLESLRPPRCGTVGRLATAPLSCSKADNSAAGIRVFSRNTRRPAVSPPLADT